MNAHVILFSGFKVPRIKKKVNTNIQYKFGTPEFMLYNCTLISVYPERYVSE